MSCAEAQVWFAPLVDGRMTLTEWALLEVHLRRCAACRHEATRLKRQAAARRLLASTRTDLESLGAVMSAARARVGSATLVARRLVRLTAATLARLTRRMASLMQAGGLGIARSITGIAGPSSRAALPLTAAGRALAARLKVGLALAGSLDCSRIGSRPSRRVTTAMLALAVALFTLQRANGPQPDAGRMGPPGLGPWAARVGTSPGTGGWTGGLPAAMLSSPPVPTSEAVRGVSFRPPLAGGTGVSAFRVIGQLATTDRRVAEPHFTALLARVSGTELGRRHRPAFTTVEVIVPRSRYDDFIHGLARIGSWRLDAARFPLPDAVHMAVRLRE